MKKILHYIGRFFKVLFTQGPSIVFLRLRIWLRRRRYQKFASMNEYQEWIKSNEPDQAGLKSFSKRMKNFAIQPSFSFLTPVYNPSAELFRYLLECVKAQIYPDWELILIDGSTNDVVETLIQPFLKSDERIRYFKVENDGISGNTNLAFQKATKDFYCFLDHDDAIRNDYLFHIVSTINDNPEAELIYFDEDKIDEQNNRLEPFFKPGLFSPEMLLSANYLTHCVIKSSLVLRVGELDKKFDGAQDWDFVLRCSEKTKNIFHIPQILYHWRKSKGSTADDFFAKSYVFEKQIGLLENHLRRRNIKSPHVKMTNEHSVHISWQVVEDKVSIIIPTKDNFQFISQCVNTILEITRYSNYEIILVDNGSTEISTIDYYKEISNRISNITIVDYNEPFNYSRANNIGAKHASGKYLLFLNNDTKPINKDWLHQLVQWACLEDIGVIGAKLLYSDQTIQHFGVVLGLTGIGSHVFWSLPDNATSIYGNTTWYRNFVAVTGACMMMREDVFTKSGGFDEDYQLTFSDLAICTEIRKLGYRNMVNPFAKLYHYEGKSRSKLIPFEDEKKGLVEFRYFIENGDPYYNPNLSYMSRIPDLLK